MAIGPKQIPHLCKTAGSGSGRHLPCRQGRFLLTQNPARFLTPLLDPNRTTVSVQNEGLVEKLCRQMLCKQCRELFPLVFQLFLFLLVSLLLGFMDCFAVHGKQTLPLHAAQFTPSVNNSAAIHKYHLRHISQTVHQALCQQISQLFLLFIQLPPLFFVSFQRSIPCCLSVLQQLLLCPRNYHIIVLLISILSIRKNPLRLIQMLLSPRCKEPLQLTNDSKRLLFLVQSLLDPVTTCIHEPDQRCVEKALQPKQQQKKIEDRQYEL